MAKKLYSIFFVAGLACNSIVAMDNGANAQQRFHDAIKRGDLPLVKSLIGSDGVDVHSFDKIKYYRLLGERPLSVAVKLDFPLIADELLRAGALATVCDAGTRETLLHTAIGTILALKAGRGIDVHQQVAQKMQLVDLLLSKGAVFTALRADGASIFHMCATHFRDARHRYPISPVCGKGLFKQLVRSVCITQGALHDVVAKKDKRKSTEQLSQVVQKLQTVFEQKGMTGKTVAEIFCEGMHDCKGDWHHLGCAAHVTILDETFIKRLKKEVIE